MREDIEAKKQIILRHGLALWDTLESCTITGASDASIRDVVPNDIAALLAKAPIEAVFCNGATAIPYLYKVSAAGHRHCGCQAAQHQPGQRRLPPGQAARGLGRGAGRWIIK